jgi:hypothetical protein
MLVRGAADEKEAGVRPPNHTSTETLPMLFLTVIATAWLAVIALFVAICRAAADGERPSVSFDELRSVSIGPKLVLSPSPQRMRPPRRRPNAHRAANSSRPLTRRLRSSGHVVR